MHQIIFYILPTVLFIASGIPQTIKLLKRKQSEDISAVMYLMTITAIIIIITDAIQNKVYSIAIANVASLSITLINFYLINYYAKKKNI